MGRAPCCDETEELKKGPWSPEEDMKLLNFIQKHGKGSWRTMPKRAGLNRCGKSCRLRWANYLRPDIKRGKFSEEEEELIIRLHSVLGNKWSAIAAHLPGRTDNEIKNHWNTNLRKKLLRMGVDPVTHSHRPELGLLANIPRLLAAANLGNLAASPNWGHVPGVRADVAQAARIQLLQSLILAIMSEPSPGIGLTGLSGSPDAWRCNMQQAISGDLLRYCSTPLPPGLVGTSFSGIDSGTSDLVSGFGIPPTPSDVQLQSEQIRNITGEALSSTQLPDVHSSMSAVLPVAPENSFGESGPLASSCVTTAASTPSLASASSPLENTNTTDVPLQDMLNGCDAPLAEAFDSWESLARDSDYHSWEAYLLSHYQSWPASQ